MKTNRCYCSGNRLFWRLTSGVYFRLMCMAWVAAVFWLLTPNLHADEEVILHPGTITGEIRLMDPDNPGKLLEISKLSVGATYYYSGGYYAAKTEVYNTNTYSLTVEAGDWAYTVGVAAEVPKYGTILYFNLKTNGVVVAENETVTNDFVTDAFLDILTEVTGETVLRSQPTVGYYSFLGSLAFRCKSSVPTNRLIIPVVSATPADPPSANGYYTIQQLNASIEGNTILRPADITGIIVNSGETVPVVFSVVPGYIEGTIDVAGAHIIGGTIKADTYPSSSTERAASFTSFGSSADGHVTFRLPCVPAASPNVSVRCYLNTDKGTLNGTNQYPEVVVGETAVCNWDFNLTGIIGGQVDIEGFPIPEEGRINLTAAGPNYSASYKTLFPPSDGSYEFTGLIDGLWRMSATQVSPYPTNVAGADCLHHVGYTFEPNEVELLPGGSETVDFAFTPGFITGRILDPNSAALPQLYEARVGFTRYQQVQSATGERTTPTSATPAENPRPEFANRYWSFVRPGLWQYISTSLSFCSHDPSGIEFTSTMGISDYYNGNYNIPPVTVSEGVTNACNTDYETGTIKVHFRVADGRPLSNPSVDGNFVTNALGVRDKSVSVKGSANSSNVVDGMVLLYAVPGTYSLRAEAEVDGSITTFGPSFRVTVGAGDIVEIDPDAPDVNISFPPGEYVTCEDSVEVKGTVTDASGVDSFTINGDPVTLDAEGNFTYTASDLMVGNNTLHLEATDINGKLTSVDRTVIRNGIPVANDDGYSLYDDEVLTIAAPGVLGNDTDADNDSLTITSHTDPASGTLTLGADGSLTYTPVGGTGGIYSFDYTIGDGKCGSSMATVTIEVKLRNQSPVMAATTASVNEDTTLTLTLATDPDSDPLIVTVTDAPDHGTASFVGGVLTYVPGPDFNGTDTLSVTVSDGRGGEASGTLVITIVPVNDPPVLASLNLSASAIVENDSVTLTGSFTDPDDGDTHVVNITWLDGVTTTLELAAGEFSFEAARQFLDDDPTGTSSDVYPIAVSVADAAGSSDTGSVELTVNNAAPVISDLSAPLAPVPLSTPPEVTVQWTDVGTLDTHTVSFAWGDGELTEMAGSAGSASATHSYATPGVYSATVTVTDDDTGSASQSTSYVVVFDPAGGFVTGAGWIESPEGAFHEGLEEFGDPTGKATFGFVSRYQKGAVVPTGNTEFQFKAGELKFKSTEYEWLVLAGARAQFKGWGAVNGLEGFGFMLTGIDGDLLGGGQPDRFRIKIWETNNLEVIYDNQNGTDDVGDLTTEGTELQGGSVVVHKP